MSENTTQSANTREDEHTHRTTVGGPRQCPECESSALGPSDNGGERVCYNCGLVIEEKNIDYGPEWRTFNSQENQQKSRTGDPTTLRRHDRGLTTDIDWKDRDAYGRTLSAKKRDKLRRLRAWQERIRTNNPGEHNLNIALSEIDRMASALGVPKSTREVAAAIYRKALSADLIRGRSIEGVATSALYAACRRAGFPRSLAEATTVSRIGQKELGRTYRYLATELELEIEPTNPKRFIPRFASKLELDESVQAKAREIIDRSADKDLLSGRSPTGFAGAALYTATLICDEPRTQKEIAEVSQVSTMTIRSRHRELVEVFNMELK